MTMEGKDFSHATRCRPQGFTLIELMIVVTVVGILASIAYPSYQNALRKANRAEAQALMQAMSQEELKQFADSRAFASCVSLSACATGLGISTTGKVNSYYSLAVTVTSTPPPSFTITATPKSGTVQASDVTLTLGSNGAKSPAGAW